MSERPWQSPSGSEPAPAAGFGGSSAQPGASLPPTPPPATGSAWTPPPRQGLIPLAPLGVGGILGASFRVLRRNPRPVVGTSLVIHIVIAIISLVITGLFTVSAMTTYFTASVNDAGDPTSAISSLVTVYGVDFLVGLIGVAGDSILQGLITVEVGRGALGEKLPLRALWALARGRILVIVLWALLIVVVVIVALGIYIGLIALLAAFGGTAGTVFAVLLGIIGVLGFIVLALWIGTKLCLVPSILVLERLTLGKAIRRSWFLTKGYFYFWRTLGIEVLVAFMVNFATSVVTIPVVIIVGIIVAIAEPTGFNSTSGLASFLSNTTQISTVITTAIAGTITAIITTATTSLIYIDIRIRKEGLDLELMKFVDARAAGGATVTDPYLPQATPIA